MKKKIALLLVLCLVVGLCACGKDTQTVGQGSEEVSEENAQDLEKTEQTAADTDATESAAAEETQAVPVTYEGVDMDSALPGLEWIETFVGNIEEAKFVIYNDTTNKKVILEDEQLERLEEGDSIALYLPDGVRNMMYGDACGLISRVQVHTNFEEIVIETDLDSIIENDDDYWRHKKKYGGARLRVTLDDNGTEKVLTCYLALE